MNDTRSVIIRSWPRCFLSVRCPFLLCLEIIVTLHDFHPAPGTHITLVILFVGWDCLLHREVDSRLPTIVTSSWPVKSILSVRCVSVPTSFIVPCVSLLTPSLLVSVRLGDGFPTPVPTFTSFVWCPSKPRRCRGRDDNCSKSTFRLKETCWKRVILPTIVITKLRWKNL